jgi:hypothetical protein
MQAMAGRSVHTTSLTSPHASCVCTVNPASI